MAVTQDAKHSAVVLGAGIFLVASMAFASLLSASFEYGGPRIERPHLLLVGVLTFCGAAYLAAVYALQRIPSSRPGLMVVVIGVGVLLRGTMIFSEPIQEDDFYRYLWDGAVTANGLNPYGFAPADVFSDAAEPETPEALKTLARDSDLVFARINHAELATVYPPIAQGAFALAHWLKPWSLGAWRAVLIGFDIATLLLLVVLLRALDKPLHLIAIYWWNPILIKEAVNSAHMDLVVLPFVLLALLFALKDKPMRSAFALALAVGAKIWPVLLVPLLYRAARASARRWAATGAVFALLTALIATLALPALVLGDRSGIVAYGERWEMNDALFMGFAKGSELVSRVLNLRDGLSEVMARVAVFGALIAWIILWTVKPIRTRQEACDRLVLVVGAIFMLSPTQFPWYYLWILPFLTLSPRPSMLILTLMLPIYYLKFHFAARDNVSLFHNGVVWLEYAPVFILALWEWRTHWRPKTAGEAA